MISPVIVKRLTVLFQRLISNMESAQSGQNLPVTLGRTLFALTAGLSPHLNGSLGANRAGRASCQIAAESDIEAVCVWLAEYRDSPLKELPKGGLETAILGRRTTA
jgi:hypothetical protein